MGAIADVWRGVEDTVRHLAWQLGRSFVLTDGWREGWIVQVCPICRIELRLLVLGGETGSALYRELFALYDGHRCHGSGCSTDEAYARAERESVRLGERALALATEEPWLAARAEHESIVLATWAQTFEQRLRAS
jgi:hypothetical protein